MVARPARAALIRLRHAFSATVPTVIALAALAVPASAATTTTTRAPSTRSTQPTTTTTRPPARATSRAKAPAVSTTTTTISDQAIAATQAEADQIAGALRQQGDQLERLAERVNGANLRIAQLDSKLGEAQSQTADTQERMRQVAQVLRVQAITAYVRGGRAALVSYSIGGAQPDEWARRQVYAQTVAGDQADALSQLRDLRRQLGDEQAQLAQDRGDAAVTLGALQADEQAAAKLAQDRKATLARVQGQLAALVEAAQARRAAMEAAQVQAELEARRRSTTTTTRPRSGPTGNAAPPVSGRPSVTGFRPGTNAPASPGDPQVTAGSGGPPARGSATAIHAAEQELGKPYEWGAAGPDSFDCSGLMVWAWSAAGVPLPHLAQDQYDMTRRVAISDLLPGDMVFYGTPSNVHHVALYVGNDTMIEAPATGEVVRYASIFRTDLLSGGRLPS